MPLLRKQPFQRLHVSSDFRDDDEVFHCEVTNEIFKDYNEFCERIILCNSLMWSCSITGRTNMTYEEALQCEENAKKSLKEFPMELRIPILYLASKTNRTSFNEMIEDVYQFARDRYFVGEMVEASFTEDSWCDCHVLQVIAPSEQQLQAYAKENNRTTQDQHYHPPAKLFRYEVEQLDCGESDVSQLMVVEAAQVRRRKQHYSRERNKIFLRQLCEQNDIGVWVVKDSVLQKYGIAKIRFDAIFDGPPPDYAARTKKPIKYRQESIDKFLTADKQRQISDPKLDRPLKKVNDTGGGGGGGGGVVVKRIRKSRVNGKFKEDLKAKALEEKAKRKEERVLESERKKEEKQKLAALAAYVRQWNKPREDLECENLVVIPEPTPVNVAVPNERFGDFALILEFLEFFAEELEVEMYFPNGLTFDLLEKALITQEVSGPWSDLLQLLLSNIFKYQAGEEDEIHASHQSSNLADDASIYEGASSMVKAVKLATVASTWCQTHQGCQLSDISLDHATLSEVLRQHLLSSGGRIGEAASKWRYSQRGGYTNQDDPALLLRINEAHVLRLLGHRNVSEFELEDKLKVASCLINQLLTFASVRDVIEERHEKLQQAKKDLKSFLIAEQKKEKEEREKMREREKEGKATEESTEEQKPKKVTRGNCEEEKRKEEYEQRLKELQQASRDDKMMLYLGSDRAHRRYWRFLSIPGLFVENDERWPGTCIPDGTPYLPGLKDRETTYAYLRNKFEDEFSDKENSFKKAKKSPAKKVAFSEKNGIKSPRKEVNARKDIKYEQNDIRRDLVACTGDKECPVHRKRAGPRWSFYGKQEDIEALINALSPRGIREGELRNNILQEKQSLLCVLEECPTYKLNPNVFSAPVNKGQVSSKVSKKSKYENVNLNYPANMSVDDVLELTLRDYILDFEDKIKAGCLGSLKITDRDAWREAINTRSYDKQCDKLLYGPNSDLEATELVTNVISVTNATIDKVKNEARHGSRPGTPDSDVGSGMGTTHYRDPGKYLGPPTEGEPVPNVKQQSTIRQMACAILQLSRAIEQKYLQRPFDDKDTSGRKYPADDVRERWEQSLLASSSWSQLFVHLSTLENSVAWGRSAFNAQCRICRRRKDAENMLLCDGCNKGHHLYCLKPKLSAVPEGDWFCSVCKPPEPKAKKLPKSRKKFEDDIEDEALLTKETRHTRAKRVPGSDDEPDRDDEHDDRDTEHDSEDDFDSSSLHLCSSCKCSGRLVDCDSCSNRYHLECVDPPLPRIPRGRWSCAVCKERKKTAKSDGSTSDDTQPRQTRRAAKRAAAAVLRDEEQRTIKGSTGKLQELLGNIRHHRDSWPFLSPVTKDEVPDYHDIITNPMDFGTIKGKLANGEYNRMEDFFGDCRLVFDNCQAYNKEHSSVYKAGMRLLKYVEKRCKELGFDFEGNENGPSGEPSVKKMRLEDNGFDQDDCDDNEHDDMDDNEDNTDNDEAMDEDDDEDEDEEEEEDDRDKDTSDDNDENSDDDARVSIHKRR